MAYKQMKLVVKFTTPTGTEERIEIANDEDGTLSVAFANNGGSYYLFPCFEDEAKRIAALGFPIDQEEPPVIEVDGKVQP
jgi:hypothetical protein